MPTETNRTPCAAAGATLGMVVIAFNGLPSLPLQVLGDRYLLLFP